MAGTNSKARGVPYVAAAGLGIALWAVAMARLVSRGCEGDGGPAVGPVLIDVNSADEAALQALPGVGETYARRIVAEREADGPFRAPEDLLRVRGATRELVEGIRPFVRFGEGDGPDVPDAQGEGEARP